MPDTMQAGGLEFFLDNRVAGDDGGPSVRVRGRIEGKTTELLRFDMFYTRPHYHYGPEGENKQYELDPLTHEDTIAWVMAQFREKLPKMVARAGYEALAETIDQATVAAVLPEMERRWRTLTPVERERTERATAAP